MAQPQHYKPPIDQHNYTKSHIMGLTDSIKSSSSSTQKPEQKPEQKSNKYSKWYGEDWGMGTTKFDDRRVSSHLVACPRKKANTGNRHGAWALASLACTRGKTSA